MLVDGDWSMDGGHWPIVDSRRRSFQRRGERSMPVAEFPVIRPPIEFTTERLRLRQWRPEDRAPFAALNADPRVMEFFPAPLQREASDAVVARWQARMDERGWGLWATEIRESGEFIGFVGLQEPAVQLPFSP